jgi:serine-type D-Ala-D-Ala carboxypeptidase/endopeptidase
MRKLLILVLVLLMGQMVNAQAEADKDIREVLRDRVTVSKTHQSIVVAITNENGTRFVSYGKTAQTPNAKNADENTIFEIGSITKVFTGTLLAEAVKRGEAQLNDPVSKYLPKNVKTPTYGGKEITLIDLATQSSGLPRLPANLAPKNSQNPYADYTLAQMYEYLSSYQLTREIGIKYEYSNFGLGLLGHILSLRAGKSYEDLVKTSILQPLAMTKTTITLSRGLKSSMAQGYDENGEPISNWDLPTLAGAGALRSTAKDMAKFVAANAGLLKSDLSGVFMVAHQPRRKASENMKIGLAWQILPLSTGDIVWHNGGTGGFRSFAGFSKAKKIGIVVLSNSAESVDDIGFHFLNKEIPLTKVKPFVTVSQKILDEYVGSYELALNAIFTITRRQDKLFAQLTGQPQFRVFAETENKFYYKVVPAQLTFNRGTSGKIESLTLSQNGDKIARKIPPTARLIESFSQIKVGMSMRQVIAICGLPDADIGSGIYIYVYNLTDGSQILISAVNKKNIVAINHSLKPVKGLAGNERQPMADEF